MTRAESAEIERREAGEFWAKFLVDGEALSTDWNDKHEFEKFIAAHPGKIPRLNLTRKLSPRDLYGMKGFHA